MGISASDNEALQSQAPARKPSARRFLLLRRLARAACLALLAVAAAGAAVTLFGPRTYHWRALDVQVSVAPSRRGQTRLVLTPLGEVSAATHRAPVVLSLDLRRIDVEKLWRLTTAPHSRQTLERDFRAAARRSLDDFAACQIGLGTLGALAVPLALRRRRARHWITAAVAGGGAVAAMLGLVASTFDWKAFREPTYTGSLRQAKAILPLAKEAFSKADTLSDRLRQVARNVKALYGRLDNLPGAVPEAEAVHILHISDLHNNRAAVDFVRELAGQFHVDAVIDTGDLTDFGVPVEAELSGGLARLSVPYLFVAGNHDSQATVRSVRALPRAVVLDGQVVTAAGLRVLGAPDPSSSRAGLGSVDTSEDAIQSAGEQLLAAFRSAPDPPDIVCVHNPRQAEPLIGLAPLILCGHMHQLDLKTDRGTVLCNAGTTGGAGTRYFYRDDGVPLSAAVLTFSRPPKPHLLSIDQVKLDGSLNQHSITRYSFSQRPVARQETAEAPASERR